LTAGFCNHVVAHMGIAVIIVIRVILIETLP